MFSRTTIASSINMPIASDRPISVSTFSVKPNACIAMNAATTEIGSVRPVMTVERHEFRNRNTMNTVSRPPRIIVTCTSSIDSRMNVESSRTTCSVTPCGISACSFATAARMPSATDTVFAPDCFCTSSVSAGRSSMNARFFASSMPSTTRATSRTRMVAPSTRLIGMLPICAAVRPRAATRTSDSVAPRSADPAGVSRFSDCSAPTTSDSEKRYASSRERSTTTPISRFASPTRLTAPTPSTVSSRRLIVLSARSVAACADMPSALTPTETIGISAGLMRSTSGSSISRGSSLRIDATLLRISCDATCVGTSSLNWTMMLEMPS